MGIKRFLTFNLPILVVAYHLAMVHSAAFSNFNLNTNWDTFQCANENPIVDEKTIILTATGLNWPQDLFCLALRKNLKVSGGYDISTQLVNVAPRSGNRNIGFAFNVKDENSYDYAYLRYLRSDCTVVEYGHVNKGILGTVNNHLPCQPLSGNGWHFFKLSVNATRDVDAYINSNKVGSFHSHFTSRGFGGVLVANGFNTVAEFRDFDISPQLADQVTNSPPEVTTTTPEVTTTNQDVCADNVCLRGGNFSSGNVFVNGQPVCDDQWDLLDANVVCKMLDFTNALKATVESKFGDVPSRFSMDDVQCLGNETSILNCPHRTSDNCAGHEGAGVVCTNNTRSENVYADVRNGDVYYQIRYVSGTLTCSYAPKGSSSFNAFNAPSAYRNGYAECGDWTEGNPNYDIRLTLGGKTYLTDETTAVANGPFATVSSG